MARVQVIAQSQVADRLYRLTFASPIPLTEEAYTPGQFLHIRVSDSFDYLLRRPLSLCIADTEQGTLTVVYRAQGAGTRRLTTLTPGDFLDVLGPLGKGFPMHEDDRHVLMIGGGIGVPPFVELARHMQRAGKRVTAVVGFQSAPQVILLEELRACGDVHVMTDDGSQGGKGLVTDLLTPDFVADVDRYYACGPTAMLRAVSRVMAEREVPGYLSLEERMGCGIGICVGCVHPIARDGVVHNVKTCREGPVFPADEVVFS